MVNKYYQKHKERLRKEACERYQNLSEEESDQRQEEIWERYPNLFEEQKQKLFDNMKKCYIENKK